MMKQREWLIIGMLLIMAISALSLNLNAVPATETITGKLLRANPTHGWIKLPIITATTINHDTNFFYFNGLGFDPQAGANMTSLTITATSITVGLSHAGTIKVYTPRGEPTTVTGGPYSYSGGVTTITTAMLSVSMTWNIAKQAIFDFYPAFALLSVTLIIMGAASILIVIRGGDASTVVVTMLITALIGVIGVVILAAISGAIP